MTRDEIIAILNALANLPVEADEIVEHDVPVGWTTPEQIEHLNTMRAGGRSHVSVVLRTDRCDDYYTVPLYQKAKRP